MESPPKNSQMSDPSTKEVFDSDEPSALPSSGIVQKDPAAMEFFDPGKRLLRASHFPGEP
jgi:hypothetical protein